MPQDKKQKKLSPYLEVYIKDDGSLIFTPLTNSTISVLREVSKDSKTPKNPGNTYCG